MEAGRSRVSITADIVSPDHLEAVVRRGGRSSSVGRWLTTTSPEPLLKRRRINSPCTFSN